MNIRVVRGALVFGGLRATALPLDVSLAYSNGPGVSARGESMPESAKQNTNTNQVKHRYWRHRGGRHPHYGRRALQFGR